MYVFYYCVWFVVMYRSLVLFVVHDSSLRLLIVICFLVCRVLFLCCVVCLLRIVCCLLFIVCCLAAWCLCLVFACC